MVGELEPHRRRTQDRHRRGVLLSPDADHVIVNVNGQDQLILGQSRDVKGEPDEKTNDLRGFDPKSGKELWKCLPQRRSPLPLVSIMIAEQSQ